MLRTVVGIVAGSALVVALVVASGCGGDEPGGPDGTPDPGGWPEAPVGTTGDTAFMIEYPAILDGGFIPDRHSGHGEDLSPELKFLNVSERAVELALIVDDPDAPTADPWVHWVVYGIPGKSTGLPEGLAVPEAGPIREGKNSWTSGKTIGWRGPLPPSGTHRYVFHLFALEKKVELSAGATKNELLAAIGDSWFAKAELEVRFAAK